MSFVGSVHHGAADVTTVVPALPARVRVICGDPFSAFVRAAGRYRPCRITIVSPWLSDESSGPGLRALIAHAQHHAATIVLLTRPPASEPHRRAVTHVHDAPGACVYLNARLHAKLYVCESAAGSGFAIVGSANATRASSYLDEVAILLRPERGSKIISELSGRVVRQLTDSRRQAR